MPKDDDHSDSVTPARNPGLHTTASAMAIARRSLLVRLSALLGTALVPALSSCGGGGGGDAAPESPSQGPPVGAGPADVKADVGFRNVSSAFTLDSRFVGLSNEKDKLTQPMFTGTNKELIRLSRLLGRSVVRIGANAVDRCSWKGAVSGLTPIQPAQIDALADYLKSTEWQLIYAVNMANNTPANAADEAAYVASRVGSSLLAFEIGNEPDLYVRNGYRPMGWTYSNYLQEWRVLRDAMLAAAPGKAFSGPATAFDLKRFTLPFSQDEGKRIALLTQHYYRADRDDPASTLDLLLRPDPQLQNELKDLVAAAASGGVAQGARLDEANSFFGGGVPNVSNAFGTGLWVVDFLFTCAVAGCSGANMHNGGSGPGYTPIAERQGVVVEARPEFYGMVMFAQAAQGRAMESVIVRSAIVNVSAWGVDRSDGGRNAVLINKDASRSVEMSVTTGIAADRFAPLWLRGTSLSAATGQTLGGVPIANDGSWMPPAQEPLVASGGLLKVILPPASAVLVRSL